MNSRELEASLGIGLIQPRPETVQEENQRGQLEESTRLLGQAFKADEVYQACKNNLNMLAGMALPDVFEYLFPPTYLAIWTWLVEYAIKTRDFSKLALGMPRGFAKTTLVKLFVLYTILFTHHRFILLVCNTQDHGVNIITDVMNMLKEPNIKKVFGDYSLGGNRDKLNLQIFTFRGRTITLAALGAEGSIRGLNVGNERPSIMIFEDFQTKEDSENEELSRKLMARMVGTIMKAKSPKGCLYLYIANMYPTQGSILRKLKDNPYWTKFIVGGILADGTSLWEELQPIQQLLLEYQNDVASGNGDIFLAEVLNDETAGLKAGIDLSQIPECPWVENVDQPQGRFIVIDPAGEKDVNDLNCVGYFEVYDGKPTIQDVEEGHWNPLELITQAIIMAINKHCALIVVENVVYQASLLFWFDHVCKSNNLTGFFFEGINPDMKSKNSRIKTMLRTLVRTTSGERSIEPTAYIGKRVRAKFMNQVLAWNPNVEKNVDEILDVMAYAEKVLRLYEPQIATEFSIDALEYANAKVLPAYATSPF